MKHSNSQRSSSFIIRLRRGAGLIWLRLNSRRFQSNVWIGELDLFDCLQMKSMPGEKERNAIGATVRWQFKKDNARTKLQRHYINLKINVTEH